MKIVGIYSVKNGEKILKNKYTNEYKEIVDVIESVNAEVCKNKVSKEKTKNGSILYNPKCLNKLFKIEFTKRGWKPVRVSVKYPEDCYVNDYRPKLRVGKDAYREMDFVKNRVGVEVQFGKYAFMVYNISAKMTIFHNLGYIDVGVEIVPVKEMQTLMSTGVSYFEQLVWDLKNRGVADIDIPVLVLGIIPESLISSGGGF